MYSKNKGITYQPTVLTPPPGYDGSRFRRRSDGRDDTFPLYEEAGPSRRDAKAPRQISSAHTKENSCPRCAAAAEDSDTYACPDKEPPQHQSVNTLTSFISGIGKEELLLIALIIILAGEKGCIDIDTILLLTLLLCAG